MSDPTPETPPPPKTNPLNTSYNKTVYTVMSVPAFMLVVASLDEFWGIKLGGVWQAAAQGFLTGLIPFLVKNKEPSAN